jgi:N-acetylneuraminic acid mutarotase
MKKFFLIALCAASVVYAYYWYVRGINLLLREDVVVLPPYAVAQRLPPKGEKPKPGAAQPEPAFEWTSALPMITPRSEVAAAAIGSRIYVIGGLDGFARTIATVEAFDVAENRWTIVSPLPKPVHHASAIAVGGKVYVFGGFTGVASTPVDTLYIYDPLTDRWSRGADLPDSTGGVALTVVEGRIHMLGGKSIGANVDSHYVYDPAANTWSSEPEMISGREQFAALTIGNRIYVFGGRQGGLLYNIDTVEAFDIDRKTWDTMMPMPLKRSGFVTLEYGGKVYVFGGEAPTTTFDQVDVYNPKTDRWSTMAERMPNARHGLAGAQIDGSFFLIGGGKRSGLSVSDLNEVLQPKMP